MKKLPPIVEQFVEDFGLSLASQGLPRIAGRLLGLILMLDEGGDLESLAAQLRVSRASVSTNTRLLESIGAIERRSLPGQRRVVYRAAATPQNRAMESMAWRMRRTLDIIKATRRDLPAAMQGASERLKRVEDYYERSIAATEAVLKELEGEHTGPRRRPR